MTKSKNGIITRDNNYQTLGTCKFPAMATESMLPLLLLLLLSSYLLPLTSLFRYLTGSSDNVAIVRRGNFIHFMYFFIQFVELSANHLRKMPSFNSVWAQRSQKKTKYETTVRTSK